MEFIRREGPPLRDMLAMPINSLASLGEFSNIRRVPGGWIYYEYTIGETDSGSVASCFVPEPPKKGKSDG